MLYFNSRYGMNSGVQRHFVQVIHFFARDVCSTVCFQSVLITIVSVTSATPFSGELLSNWFKDV